MAELTYEITVDESGLIRGIRNARKNTDDLGSDMEKNANRGIAAFTRLEKVIAGTFTIGAIKSFIQDMIRVRGEFQQTEAAYRTMLGSKELADRLMAESVQLAAVTPFGLSEVTKATKQLLAYGESAGTVTETLRMLGNVAAGVGSAVGDIAYLYGTLRTQGRAYQNDINQFAGRGIPIYRELAKVLKINEDEVRSFVEAGKVGFPQIEQVFKNLTAQGGMFYNLMEEQSRTLTGQIANLEDAWDSMLNQLGERTQGVTGAAISGLIELVENYEKVLGVISALVSAYGSYRAALLLTMALEKLAILQRAGVTASFALQYAQLVLLQKAQAAYNAVLAAAPIAAYTALILALGAAIYSLTQTVNAAEEAESAIKKAREASEKTIASETRAIESQISVLQSSTATAEQKAAALTKLNGLTNGAVKGYSAEEIAAGKAKTAIDEYIKSVGKAIQAREAFAEYNRLGEEIDELNAKGIDALSWSEKLGQSLKNTFAPTSQGLTASEWWDGLFNNDSARKRIVDQVRDAKRTAQEEIKKQFGNIWNEAVTGVSNEQQTPTRRPRTVDVIEAEIKALKDKQSAESETSEQYKKFQREIIALEKELAAITGKINKETKKELSDRKKFLLELAKIEDEINRKSLTATEEKIQSERDRFAQLRREAATLGFGEGVAKRIDRAEAKAINDISYSEETDRLAKVLQRQQKMWEDYYVALDNVNENYARNKYEVDLDYERKLQDAIAPLMKKRLDGTISGVEEERLRSLVQLQDDFGQMQEQRDAERYARAYQAAMTHNQKLEAIEKEYRENVAALGAEATADQLAQLKLDRDAKISAETSAALTITSGWDKMYRALDRMGKRAVREYLKQVKDRVEAEFAAGKLTQDQFLDWQRRILDANERLASRDPFSALGASIRKYIKLLKDSNALETEKTDLLNQIASQASMAFSDANQVVGSLADGLETLGIGGEGLQETLGKVQDTLSGLSEVTQGLATGNPAAIISGAIKTLSSVLNLFNTRDKRLQKQIEGYQKALKALEYQYDQLQRKIDNSVGKSYYDDSEAAIANLQEQIRNLAAARDAESKKKKADKEAIQQYNDAIYSAEKAIEDINRAVSEQLLQTNFKQLSQNLADALLSAFEAGENGIKSMNSTFDDFIKSALANSLKLKLIEPLMKKMTDDLTAYMLENDQSVAGYDFSGWRSQLEKAGKDFNEALEDAYSELGLKKGDQNTAGLSGTIGRSITEDTANKWMGVQLNMYTISKSHFAEAQLQSKIMQSYLSIAQKNLDAALGIERNTAGTWNEVKNAVVYLSTIANNTKPGKGLRDLGVI